MTSSPLTTWFDEAGLGRARPDLRRAFARRCWEAARILAGDPRPRPHVRTGLRFAVWTEEDE